MQYETIRIDCSNIFDAQSFHRVFAAAFGFPSFYGANMDAWIDCMTSLDAPDDGMTSVTVGKGGIVVLQLDAAAQMRTRCRRVYDDLLDCAGFVNWRRMQSGDPPILCLSFA
ncbi:barstar family protein [Phyllobacterium myrsinacearum]|uniref:Barnase inhibitor n=1 Tax=Phyllobacterium myrsinacearum TaxID=28101 RepID=A0A2S9JDC8_9HYPH|nr:barstar family protein [Phyllobacterium myrsinacearum]PRD50869.1 barnase inhibitor [Phyllobacterium myrsinacearum]PWV86094.1 barstar (barnase inhibitor) [Phyllobacterium myrsinacearum]RZS88884.1 barstar (barnase inhibitor) [Phyllobacterium myrsinacearum]RZU97732.1 barstar (barnase inhibitor) [Phyllobacterium myrsinacearum]